MPRLTTSKLGTVLAFFRSATMEIAEAGLDLARDIIRERKQTAEKIRQGQLKNKPPAAAAAIPAGVLPAAGAKAKGRKRGPKPGAKAKAAATAATGPKKSHHKKKPATPAAPAAASERRRAPRQRATPAASEPVPETEANLPLIPDADDFVPEPELEQV